MGSTRTSDTTQNSSQNTTYKPTEEEIALNKLQLDQAKEFDPIQRDLNRNAGNLVNQLLLGQSNLPGFLSRLPGGISPEVTQGIVDQSLRDVNAQLAASGVGSFMDSGVAQSIAGRTSGDIRMGSEQFNLGNILNLLNLAVGGQAQVQQPALSTASMLSQRLAGLRGISQTGTMTSNTTMKSNPFMESFMSGLGGSLSKFADPTTYFTAAALCWVASEIFDGWDKLKTRFARVYIALHAPRWFYKLYKKHGQFVASFIHDKPMVKEIIRPLFELFAIKGGYHAI